MTILAKKNENTHKNAKKQQLTEIEKKNEYKNVI